MAKTISSALGTTSIGRVPPQVVLSAIPGWIAITLSHLATCNVCGIVCQLMGRSPLTSRRVPQSCTAFPITITRPHSLISNSDGRLDFVYTRSGEKTAEIYLATDELLPGGAPVFVPAGSVSVTGYYPCRAVDLNRDGAIDLIINGQLIENAGPTSPFEAASTVDLDAGDGACFSEPRR